jgi:hypothetical protein
MAAIKKGGKCAKLVGAPRGWHLKKSYTHTDGAEYSFGQLLGKAPKKRKATSKKAAKPKAVKPKAKKSKKGKGKLEVKKLTVFKVVYTEDDRQEDVSDLKLTRAEAEGFLERQYERYGEDLKGAPFMILRKHGVGQKRGGWAVIEKDGTRHEYIKTSKRDAKVQFLRKFGITRMPHGTKIEKL